MKINSRYTLSLFIVGLLVTCLTSLFYFITYRNEVIQSVQNQLLNFSSDSAYHLQEELLSKTQMALTITKSPLIKEIITESNQYFGEMEEDRRVDVINQLNTEWMASDADSPLVRSRMENDIAEYFHDLQTQFPDTIGEIFLTNAYGAVVSTTEKLTTFSHAHKYWWQEAYNMGEGISYFDDRGYDESVDGYVLGVVVPVKVDEEITAMLKINFLVEALFNTVVNSAPLEGRKLVISRISGEIIKDKGREPLSTEIDNIYLQWIQSGQTNGAAIFDRKENLFVSYSILQFSDKYLFGGSAESIDHSQGSPGEPWIIISTYEQDVALSGFMKQILYIAVSGLIVLISIALISMIISKRLVQPIKNLVEFSKSVGEGDLGAQVPINRTDELGILAQAMNTMAKDLYETMASRKELEEQVFLREKEEEKFQQLFTTMSEGFATHKIILDEQQNPVDYRFLSVNPAFERETGLTASEVVGKTVREVMPGTEVDWITKYGRVAQTGESEIFEQYSSVIDKYFRVMAFSPTFGEFATIFSDISSIKKTEQQLVNDRNLFFTTLNTISDAVIVTDAAGCISFINKEAQKLLLLNPDDTLGTPVAEVCNLLALDTEECPVSIALREGTGFVTQVPIRVDLHNGMERQIEYSISPISTTGREIFGIVIVCRDVTEKEKQRSNLIRSDKLDSLGLLAGGIAHDFNNYLSGIFGYIELTISMLETTGNRTEVEYLQLALEVFEKTKGLTQQLLTFAKGGAPKTTVVDLGKLLQDNTEFALSGSNSIPLYDINNDLWTCLCDVHQIGQCIDNIVINAKQAMPGGGALKISAENISNIPYHFDTDKTAANYIKICIADEGSGIPLEVLSKIYDPFFSTKKAGHGLGLATVYSIIDKHKGWIEVESKEGEGTAFTFYLPAGEQHTPIIDDTGKSEFFKGEGHILVMDDQEFIREIVTKMLQLLGYTVTAVASGKEAILTVQESLDTGIGSTISACILDLTLPGDMDGKDVAKEIKQFAPELVCIASSGYTEDPVMASPKNFCFTSSIAKPFMIKDLSRVLKDALEAGKL
jgi:PAS domain S-box-containing protein